MGLLNKSTDKGFIKSSFGRSGNIEQRELKSESAKMPVRLPGSPRMLSRDEKKELAGGIFDEKKYGRFIDKQERTIRLRELVREKQQAKTFQEKAKAVAQIDVLKRIIGRS
ncbi:MAG: hypothetical protein AAB620_01500 [Patescibacteria group bacterium]